MKKYLFVSIFILALLLIGNNYYQTRQDKEKKQAAVSSTQESPKVSIPSPASITTPSTEKNKVSQNTLAVINIGGFDCPSCPAIAEAALKDTPGILDAKTTSSGEVSRVLYDSEKVTIEDIKKALGGYTLDRIISQTPTQDTKLK